MKELPKQAISLVSAAAMAFPGVDLGGVTSDMPTRDVWVFLCKQLGLDAWTLADALSRVLDCPVARDLAHIDFELLRKVPSQLVRSQLVLPWREDDKGVIVALANPFDELGLEGVRFALSRPVKIALAPPDDLDFFISKAYGRLDEQSQEKLGHLFWDEHGKPTSITKTLGERAVPKLAREMLLHAIGKRASDLHVQPFFQGSIVRIRVDGMLERLVFLPQAVADGLVRYFQAQGGMDPTNPLIPQDGRMSLVLGDSHFDMRISVLPSAGGQRLVIRFLEQDRVYRLANGGFSLLGMQTLQRFCENVSGVILFTGPTGCGKTSTLYSMLAEINREDINIVTVEDPVEYKMPGVSQVEVNPKANLTFAAALRSILRQDPDVILVGEIRDEETARIAMQSALTGHLVFSTLHTNDAVTAIPRLMDLGVSPRVLADAVSGIVSQRLLRKLCEHCRSPVLDDDMQPEEILFQRITKVKPGARAAGCEKCAGTGYSGRIPLLEIIEMNPALAELIRQGVQSVEALQVACGDRFNLIGAVAAKRIMSGDTSPSEAARVIGRKFWMQIAHHYGHPLPDVGVLGGRRQASEKIATSVLLLSSDQQLQRDFTSFVKQAWFGFFSATTGEEAKQVLQHESSISFVVVDVSDELDDAGVVSFIDNARLHMAWSRLPALILLPRGREYLQQLLVDAGANSPFLHKPVVVQSILEKIAEALR